MFPLSDSRLATFALELLSTLLLLVSSAASDPEAGPAREFLAAPAPSLLPEAAARAPRRREVAPQQLAGARAAGLPGLRDAASSTPDESFLPMGRPALWYDNRKRVGTKRWIDWSYMNGAGRACVKDLRKR